MASTTRTRRALETRGKAGAEAGSAGFSAIPSPVRGVLRSPGHPLDPQIRATLEPRFGHDFSRVRVHSDGAAARSAQALQASAYTLGSNVVFGHDRYQPRTSEGLELLSHELAHVVQQSSAARTSQAPRRAGSAETSTLEVDADRAADAVLRHGRLRPSSLHAAPMAVQRQPVGTPTAAAPTTGAVSDKTEAETAHRADQQRIYAWLQGDTVWDRARRPERDTSSLAPDQKAKDPHVIFNNSIAWLRSGRISLSVLSRVPGQPDTARNVKFFDPTVNLPDLGGSVDQTVELAKDLDADTDAQGHINFIAKPNLTEVMVRDTFRHEVQHVADAHAEPGAKQTAQKDFQAETGVSSTHALLNATIWSNYESEFRGYWVGSIARPGFQGGISDAGTPVMVGGSGGSDRWGSETGTGGELKVTGHEDLKKDWPSYVPEATIQLDNEKQTRIANHIVHNYFGMEETFLTSPLFRDKIQALTKPQGINLVNSVRIDKLRRAIQGPATHISVWTRTITREQDVAAAVRDLDAADRAFLKDTRAAKPFWDDARQRLSPAFFTWLEGNVLRDTKDPPPAAAAQQPAGPGAGAGP